MEPGISRTLLPIFTPILRRDSRSTTCDSSSGLGDCNLYGRPSRDTVAMRARRYTRSRSLPWRGPTTTRTRHPTIVDSSDSESCHLIRCQRLTWAPCAMGSDTLYGSMSYSASTASSAAAASSSSSSSVRPRLFAARRLATVDNRVTPPSSDKSEKSSSASSRAPPRDRGKAVPPARRCRRSSSALFARAFSLDAPPVRRFFGPKSSK
mmetsp:Transcript_7265/g.23254  ORF Transcript_7265/g.23254 Transcript_7265/m.23254 type:complete len:208 (-) Transcript_7265:246-869(-)